MSCNNCGKYGHQFHQCKNPITSFGLIVCRYHPFKGYQYLMIRRRHSFGYIDFMRGKFTLSHQSHLRELIDEMSQEEKKTVLSMKQFKHMANQKKNTVELNDKESINKIHHLVKNSSTDWSETEWEFPKGRRNVHEKEVECAIREFTEETGITDISIVQNIFPLEEIFIGSNFKAYKHRYYLGYMKYYDSLKYNLSNFQTSEVSKVEWKSLDECMRDIRNYNKHKKRVLRSANQIMTTLYVMKIT